MEDNRLVPMTVLDQLGRPLRTLRVSVTDRCNLRCAYCMPEADYVWLPRADVLTFEEVLRVVDAFAALGVDRVRLTGGEPLLRRDLPTLVAGLAARRTLRDLAPPPCAPQGFTASPSASTRCVAIDSRRSPGSTRWTRRSPASRPPVRSSGP